jgi:hypothetical protein
MTFSLPYLAGFFDGEGSVGVYRSGRRYGLVVQCTQTTSPLTQTMLELLAERFGGHVSWQATSTGRGKLNWQIRGDRAAELLKQLEPHLVLKRHQAEVAIAWQRQRVRSRDARGRVTVRGAEETALNDRVVALMARLKRANTEAVEPERLAVLRSLGSAVLVSA